MLAKGGFGVIWLGRALAVMQRKRRTEIFRGRCIVCLWNGFGFGYIGQVLGMMVD